MNVSGAERWIFQAALINNFIIKLNQMTTDSVEGITHCDKLTLMDLDLQHLLSHFIFLALSSTFLVHFH